MKCPYCGSEDISQWTATHRDEVYTHYRCDECGTDWESLKDT